MNPTAVLSDDGEMLDNPVWSALNGGQARLGEGGSSARRFQPDVSPFAAVKSATEASLQALRVLLPEGESALLVSQQQVPAVDGLHTSHLFDVLQMIDTPGAGGDEGDAVRLTASDASDMVDLASRTKPGPFGPRTFEMGDYIGLRHNGRLVAMAGERLQVGRFVEISAVCVDAEFRGQGIASRLMNRLRRQIFGRGGVPFLHVRSDAMATMRLYEKLGFAPRATLNLHQVRARKRV